MGVLLLFLSKLLRAADCSAGLTASMHSMCLLYDCPLVHSVAVGCGAHVLHSRSHWLVQTPSLHGAQPSLTSCMFCVTCRYGAVPVVRKTGGLADTVRDVESHAPGEGNGYTFDGTDEGSLHSALDRALAHFKDRRKSWGELSNTNMNTELSWSRSSADYVALYNSISMP